MKAAGIQTAGSWGSSELCALLGTTASMSMLNAMARPLSNSRGPNFPETLSQNLPDCHGHFTARHSHKSSRATVLLRGKVRQCHAEQHRSSSPSAFCRPELNRAAPRGCTEGKERCLTQIVLTVLLLCTGN